MTEPNAIDTAAARELLAKMQLPWELENGGWCAEADHWDNQAGIVYIVNHAAELLDAVDELDRLEGMLLACAAYVNRSVAAEPLAAVMATAIMPLGEIPDAVAKMAGELDRLKLKLADTERRNVELATRAGNAEGKLLGAGWHGGVDAMLEKFHAELDRLRAENAELKGGATDVSE